MSENKITAAPQIITSPYGDLAQNLNSAATESSLIIPNTRNIGAKGTVPTTPNNEVIKGFREDPTAQNLRDTHKNAGGVIDLSSASGLLLPDSVAGNSSPIVTLETDTRKPKI